MLSRYRLARAGLSNPAWRRGFAGTLVAWVPLRAKSVSTDAMRVKFQRLGSSSLSGDKCSPRF